MTITENTADLILDAITYTISGFSSYEDAPFNTKMIAISKMSEFANANDIDAVEMN